MNLIILMVFLVIVVNVKGFFIPNKNSEQVQNSNEKLRSNNLLESWPNIERKLKVHLENLKNSNHHDSQDSVENSNELQVLYLIPSIIEQIRSKHLNKEDKKILSEIYGSMWSMIQEEAERSENEEMNPILKALLESFHSNEEVTNDIEGNTLRKINRKKHHKKPAKKLNLNVNRNDHVSQRILKIAAIMIHRVMNSRNENPNKKEVNFDNSNQIAKKSKLAENIGHPRTATINLRLTNIPIQKITRTKRNILINVRNDKDLPAAEIDGLLKLFRQNHGIDSDETEEDYTDDPKKEILNKSRDDLYDDLYEDDEEAVVPKSINEFGSFQDLILLAEKQRQLNEKEEMKLKPKRNHYF